MKRRVLVGLGAVALGLAWALVPLRYPPLVRGASLPPADQACEGFVLEATPGRIDPDFEGAEVLICRHDAEGALGFQLGGAGPLALDERFEIYEQGGQLRWTNCALDRPFPMPGWARGPRVSEEQRRYSVLGYAGWAPGQLEAELEAGAWRLRERP